MRSCFFLLIASVAAAAAGAAEPRASAVIEVTGTRSDDAERRDATGARVVVGREELGRYGEPTLLEALKRTVGISVVQTPGKPAELRLRGLGNGQTQILLNGTPVPPGFSVDSLAPSMVERVEVLRSAAAETGTQAIAGSVNIVLRAAGKRDPRETQAALRVQEPGPAGLQLSHSASWREGAHAFALTAAAARDEYRDVWHNETRIVQGAGTETGQAQDLWRRRQSQLSAAPQWTWKPGTDSALKLDGLLQWRGTRALGGSERLTLDEAGASTLDAQGRRDESERQHRASVQWNDLLGGGRRLMVSLASTGVSRRIEQQRDDRRDGQPSLSLHTRQDVDERSTNLGLRHSWPLGDAQTLSAGLALAWREQSQRSRQQGESTTAFPDLDADTEDRVRLRDAAAYLQHAWEPDASLSSTIGLRLVKLRLEAGPDGAARPVQHKTLVSPTAQLRWAIPGRPGHALRVALAQTYRVPVLRELATFRVASAPNTPLNPDLEGAAALRPEVAVSADLGYEFHPGKSGLVSLNLYERRISDTILNQTAPDARGRWVATPVNAGSTRAWGIEFESRVVLAELDAALPPTALRLNLAHNETRVLSLPGPDRRLARTPGWVASLGADHKLAAWPITLGASLLREHSLPGRRDTASVLARDDRRDLDLYALWRIDPAMQLRVSALNVLRPGYAERTSLSAPGIDAIGRVETRRPATLRMVLTIKG